MNLENAVLARKYAQVFLDKAGSSFTIDDYKQLSSVKNFLTNNRRILFLLNISTLEKAVPQVAAYISQQFNAKQTMQKLIALLVKQRRALLLPDILHHIADLYEEFNNILYFTIKSSHPLNDNELDTVVQFLTNKSNKRIVYEYQQDSRLIAGISLTSSTRGWEYTVEGALEKLKQVLTMRI